MSEVTFQDGVASQYLTPNTWWKWLLTGKLKITEQKAYLVTWFSKTELGKVENTPANAMLEEGKLKLIDEEGLGIELNLEGYRWSKPGEFNGRNALIAFSMVALVSTIFFARKV